MREISFPVDVGEQFREGLLDLGRRQEAGQRLPEFWRWLEIEVALVCGGGKGAVPPLRICEQPTCDDDVCCGFVGQDTVVRIYLMQDVEDVGDCGDVLFKFRWGSV